MVDWRDCLLRVSGVCQEVRWKTKKRIYEAGSIDNRDLANGGVRNE